METETVVPGESSPVPVESPEVPSAETVKKPAKGAKPSVARPTLSSAKKGTEAPELSSTRLRTVTTKSAAVGRDAPVLKRRNSTGVLPEKQPAAAPKRLDGVGSFAEKKISPSASEPPKRSTAVGRRASLPSASAKVSAPDVKKSSVLSSRLPTKPEHSKIDSDRKPSSKPLFPISAVKKIPSSPPNGSHGRGQLRKAGSGSNVSSPSTRSPSVTNGSKLGSADKGPLSGPKKSSTPENWDSRFIMLPQVEIKSGDDLRLDLRGHRIRSLNASGLNLSPNLEFVYLRDNLLSSLEGIEILKRVKVLDLSFNDFKGPGFEPLENCKALQQLYLAGNQITALISLPQLPNLEFLSVAQNRLKSLSMASQPRLQVLAASKNKISTLKGFPHLPLLEHLRVEENPILEMPHLEAASILLVGPTLKKFNDRDLSPEEQELAKKYPAHTPLCIRDGWEFCHPDLAADSTFHFLVEHWKDCLPHGYMLKEASVDQPFEQDACHCHFVFANDCMANNGSELLLKYQWFIGEKTPTNFVAIAGAVGEVYWPRHEDVGKFLKVECTPVLEGREYPPIFSVSLPVSPGTGFPKVLNLTVHGELVEGNAIKGFAEIAWCGGTPGKGVASWLRRRWNSSPVVIAGAEDEEYRLTVEDIDCSLVFMFTPVTEEGVKGEPQYAMTDFIRAASPSVRNVKILGDAVEGNTMRGVGEYFGGREGPSKFEWLRENKENGDLHVILVGATEYTLTKEDVGRRLAFVYIPINFEGQEGESVSVMSDIIKKAPPRVSNLKIVGDLREGNKVTVTAIVTGGTEGSSRVQWFKTSLPKFEGESSLEAMSTSKIAKAFRVPLGAVGHYIVAKFTPIAPDGESGEPAYVVSEKAVETLPPSLNFLSVTGDYYEGEMLTASYGYIGGHEGKSLYTWYLHENETDAGALISEASGFLQYRIPKDAIGKFVSFKCTPIRDDGTVGEPRTCLGLDRVRPGSPKLLSLHIIGEAVEGTTLQADKKYWGGEEGNSVFHWFLTSSDGMQTEINGVTAASHTLSTDEIGFMVSVSCEPIRSDGAHGPTVLSEQVGPVLPGETVFLKSVDASAHVKDAKLLVDLLDKVIKEVGVQHVIQIVTDNESSYVADGKMLMAAHPHLFWTPCAAHCLDLMLEDISKLSLMKEIIRRAKLVTTFIYGHTRILAMMRKYTDDKNLARAAVTRFATNYLNLQSLFDCKDGLRRMFTSADWLASNNRWAKKIEGKKVEGIILKTSFWNGVAYSLQIYKPLVMVLRLVDGEKPAMGYIYEAMDRAKESIKSALNDKLDKYGPIWEIIDRRWDFQMHRPLHAAGLYVNPALYFSNSQIEYDQEVKQGLYDCIEKLVPEPSCQDAIFKELAAYQYARGLFGREMAIRQRTSMVPGPPTCQSLKFMGSMTEGERLSFTATYSGGERGECTHEWYRVKNNGAREKLRSSVFLDLTLADVGVCIELVYTPVRKDGLRGNPKSIISSAIAPADPKGLELALPDCCEDQEVIPLKSYYGGEEGFGEYVWYRSRRKLESTELENISHANEIATLCGEMMTYTPSLEDVGSYLILYWVPTRADGKLGDPVVAVSDSPVTAAPPVVSYVQIRELSSGVYIGEGTYYGGHEGLSLYSWYRETNEGTIVLINGANSTTYKATDSDYTCRLLFGYTPVRSDSVVGELKLSEPTGVILPEIPKIQKLSFAGREVEGEILTAVEIIPDSETQQNVWSKYKKEVKYQWFYSTEIDDKQFFEALHSQHSCSYKLHLEDIGRCLKCECIAMDVFGRSSEPVSAVSSPISPGIPKIHKLEIEGRGFHTNLYAVRGVYSGGKEGKSKIQWLRSMVGSPDLISIPGETGRMYEGNVDDVGYRLVAIYTPVREDEVEGQPVSASTEPVAIEPDVYKEVKQKIELGSVKFEVLCEKDHSPKKAPGAGNLERRILEVNRKRVKVVKPGSKTSFPTTEIRGSYAPPFHVEVSRNDQHRFKIVVDSENEVDLMVQTRHMRDVIVLVIRGLAQRFNSTSLNSLLKIET